MTELRKIDFAKNIAVTVDNADLPSDDHVGQLVYFTGNVSVDDNAVELSPGSALNITSPLEKALVIIRSCLIYQKMRHADHNVKNDMVGGGQATTTT